MKGKIVISIIFLCCCLGMFTTTCTAQDKSFTIYYDSLWNIAPKEAAVYYTNFAKQDTFYKCTSYWVRSNRLNCTSTYKDTIFYKGVGNFHRGIGKMMRYYEDGAVSDSILFDKVGNYTFQFHYRQNGKTAFHIFYDKISESWLGENYDSITGKKIPGNYTYMAEAKFPGGAYAWMEYLSGHLKAKVPVKKGAPPGLYTVVVKFIVDPKGNIGEVQAVNDPGYGTADEAIRVVKNGPRWIPAEQKGIKVNFYQEQSITFSIAKE